jgi:hypothetical protein
MCERSEEPLQTSLALFLAEGRGRPGNLWIGRLFEGVPKMERKQERRTETRSEV